MAINLTQIKEEAIPSSTDDNTNYDGIFGFYSHQDGIGQKPLYGNFMTLEKVLLSQVFVEAVKEALYGHITRTSSKSSVKVPKYHSVDIVCINNEWHAVIFMEHIDGVTADEKGFRDGSGYCESEEDMCPLFLKTEKKIIKLTERAGLDYRDCHNGNIIVKADGTIYVIDFSPEYIKYQGDTVQWNKLVKRIFPKLTKQLCQKLNTEQKALLRNVFEKMCQLKEFSTCFTI